MRAFADRKVAANTGWWEMLEFQMLVELLESKASGLVQWRVQFTGSTGQVSQWSQYTERPFVLMACKPYASVCNTAHVSLPSGWVPLHFFPNEISEEGGGWWYIVIESVITYTAFKTNCITKRLIGDRKGACCSFECCPEERRGGGDCSDSACVIQSRS